MNTEIPNRNNHSQFVDPEPMSVFLGVITFLGSVTSIAGYVR